MVRNPFITSGYLSAEYFCDRKSESRNLIQEITNGNNLALISTRRMRKIGLIQHKCYLNVWKRTRRMNQGETI